MDKIEELKNKKALIKKKLNEMESKKIEIGEKTKEEKDKIEKEIEDMKNKKTEVDEETKKEKEKIKEEIREKTSIKRNKPKETNHANKLIRVSTGFDEQLEDIQKEVPGISKPKITELIVTHNKLWSKMKQEIINFNLSLDKKRSRNKKGQATIFLFFIIVGLLFALLMLLVGGIITIRMNDALDQDLDMGQVNLQDINDDTFGKFAEMYLGNADWWGISIIFGMILGLFLSAYFMRNRFPKWAIVLDIFIILAMFIVALYISSSYSILLDSLSSAGETFLEDYTPKTSGFMINLPIFIAVIGTITMVLLHASIPTRSEERIRGGGILQGVQ